MILKSSLFLFDQLCLKEKDEDLASLRPKGIKMKNYLDRLLGLTPTFQINYHGLEVHWWQNEMDARSTCVSHIYASKHWKEIGCVLPGSVQEWTITTKESVYCLNSFNNLLSKAVNS